MNHSLVKNGTEALPVAAPRFRSTQQDDHLTLAVELPGIAPEQVHLFVEEGVLHLEAKGTPAPAGKEVLRQALEFQPTDFRGRWRLPENVDADGITSGLRHGVLELVLPLRRPVRRKIAVG